MLYLLNHCVIKIIVTQHYFFIYLEIFQLSIVFVLAQHLLNYHPIMQMHFQMLEWKLNYRNEIKNEKNIMDKPVINRRLLLKRQRQIRDNSNNEEENHSSSSRQERHLNPRKLVLESDVCVCVCL